jgi:hypothetical protein
MGATPRAGATIGDAWRTIRSLAAAAVLEPTTIAAAPATSARTSAERYDRFIAPSMPAKLDSSPRQGSSRRKRLRSAAYRLAGGLLPKRTALIFAITRAACDNGAATPIICVFAFQTPPDGLTTNLFGARK